MAWSAMPSFADGNLLTAAQLMILVGNINESAPAKATTSGSHFAATSTNAIAERRSAEAFIATSQSNSSTAFVNLTTIGPQVTVTSGTICWVSLYASFQNSTTTASSVMGYGIGGATTFTETDDRAISTRDSDRVGGIFCHTGMTAGSNGFTARYRVSSASTGTWSDRRMAIFPL